MQFGFSKVDITPRVGVGLYGFGPFLCRFSKRVREPLHARAVAAADGGDPVVLVSADLVGLAGRVTDEVRQRVADATGLPGSRVMVHCTHTHCGPATKDGFGQGVQDPPYMEILPVRLARACVEAIRDLQDAAMCRAAAPAEGIGYSREHDQRPTLEDALKETYRPAKPEFTDTTVQVLRIDRAAGPPGFMAYFSCHPVVCCADSRAIHGDFAGVAMSMIERESPGTVGLYLQGGHGNVNTCVVHHPEQESLLALDVIASRFARSVRAGLRKAQPMPETGVAAVQVRKELTHAPAQPEQIRSLIAEREAVVKAQDASDADRGVRRATVDLIALRRELQRQTRGEAYDGTVELHGLRMGDVTFVGAPFELAHRYKRRVQAQAGDRTLVMSLVSDARGYAPEREAFEQAGNYSAQVVPYLLGYPPFAPDVEDDLVAAFVEMDGALRANIEGR